MAIEYCDVDGQVALGPEDHLRLCEGLSPWLGFTATSVTAVQMPPMCEGDGAFNWERRSDCAYRVHVIARGARRDGATVVESTFRWYEKDGTHHPWESDAAGRGLSQEAVGLLAELATATQTHALWYDRQVELVETGQELQHPPQFTRLTAAQFEALLPSTSTADAAIPDEHRNNPTTIPFAA